MTTPDVIDRLMGLQPGDFLSDLRHERPAVRQHSQGSFDALLTPAEAADLSPTERDLVALRVATLHACAPLVALHRERLAALGIAPAAMDAAAAGPDAKNATAADGFDARTVALLRHADLQTLSPIEARPVHLHALADVGLTPAAIVTLSQLIAFVAYQVRVVAGLTLLERGPA